MSYTFFITHRCFGDSRTSGGPIVALFYSLFPVATAGFITVCYVGVWVTIQVSIYRSLLSHYVGDYVGYCLCHITFSIVGSVPGWYLGVYLGETWECIWVRLGSVPGPLNHRLAGIAQLIERLPCLALRGCGGTIDSGFKPHQCLLTCMWKITWIRLPTLALKPRGYITRSPKTGLSVAQRKGLRSSKKFDSIFLHQNNQKS